MEESATNDSSPRAIALLIGVTLLALFPVCRSEFVLWDDTHNFLREDAIARVPPEKLAWFWREPQKDLYVPVTYTLWWTLGTLVPRIDGSPSPYVFHTLNLVVHLASVLAAFALLRQLGFRSWPACLGAMVFAVHPVQVESVAWASATKDILAGLFTVLALLGYLKWLGKCAGTDATGGFAYLALATFAFVLAMLSKPSAVVTPALAAVATWYLSRHVMTTGIAKRSSQFWASAIVITVWVLLALPFIWIAHGAQPASSVATPLNFRPIVALDALAFYAKQAVAPLWLAMDYGRSPQWLASSPQRFWTWTIPVAIAIGALAFFKRAPFLTLGIAFFAVALLPVLGFIPFDFQSYSTVADHYLYVAVLGVGTIVAGLLSVAPRPAAYLGVGLCIGFFAIRSHVQTWSWHDSQSLFRHTLAINPQSVVANVNLGKLRADEADAFKTVGQLNEAMTRSDEAISLYKRALASAPNDADAHKNLGHMYKLQQRWSEAEMQYRAVLSIRSHEAETLDDADTHVQLGVTLGNQGRIKEAAEEFKEALQIVPDDVVWRALFEQANRMLQQSRSGAP